VGRGVCHPCRDGVPHAPPACPVEIANLQDKSPTGCSNHQVHSLARIRAAFDTLESRLFFGISSANHQHRRKRPPTVSDQDERNTRSMQLTNTCITYNTATTISTAIYMCRHAVRGTPSIPDYWIIIYFKINFDH
jgi:hypothetical protein